MEYKKELCNTHICLIQYYLGAQDLANFTATDICVSSTSALWKNFHNTFVVAAHFTTQLMEKKTEFSVDERDGTYKLILFDDRLARYGTGSLGHQVSGSFGSSLTSGSQGHHFDSV